jgi:hypothetical protein
MHGFRASLAAALLLPMLLVAPVLAHPLAQSSQATITPTDRQWIAPGSSATWTIALPPNQRGLWDLIVDGPDPRLAVAVTGDSQTLTCGVAPRGGPACSHVPGTVRLFRITISAGYDANGFTQDIPIYINDVNSGGQGILAGNLRMPLAVGATPTPTPPAPTPGSGSGVGTPDCSPQPLVFLDGVTNQGGGAAYNKLIVPAAASFQAVRQEISARTGMDALVVLGDVLRHPAFATIKAGVANYSWHKAGRAVDLNQGGPFQVRREGTVFRLFIGDVDITAIFIAHGWNRIAAQGATLEWWHYEYHPDGIAWASAMLQAWPISTLHAAFPEITWGEVGCTAGGLPLGNGEVETTGCVPDPPHWTDSGVGYGRGCGPPVLPPDTRHRTGTPLRQFIGIVGWLGDSGRIWPPAPAGVHLHLGLDVGTTTDVCRWPYQIGHVPPSEPPPGGTQCLTTWADPLQFLPRANQDTLRTVAETPVPAAAGQAGDPTYGDALVQLPPPGHPAGLLLPPAKPDKPGGTWWSPGNDDRANNARCPLGGPAAADWISWIAALLFPWLFGC